MDIYENIVTMERYSENHAHLLLRTLVPILEIFLLYTSYSIIMSWQGMYMYLSWELSFSVFSCMGMIWLCFGIITGYYHYDAILNAQQLTRTFANNVVVNIFVLLVFKHTLNSNYFGYELMGYSFLLSMVGIFGLRLVVQLLYQNRRRLFALNGYKVLIVGDGRPADELKEFFTKGHIGQVFQFLKSEDSYTSTSQMVQNAREKISEIKEFCLREKVNEVYCTLPLEASDVIQDFANFADNNYIHFKIANDFQVLQEEGNVAFFNSVPVITLRKNPLSSWANRVIKRTFDLAVSSFVCLFLLPPLYLVIGLLIKLDSRGPITFVQKRSGRRNKDFSCLKFRTMIHGADKPENQYVQASKGDPRITNIGAFLRKTSLDEFPQFLNVLLGDMSIVGPRPHPNKLNDEYTPIIKNYLSRYAITPGITGHAQVNGYRGETKNPQDMRKRIEYDTWYIKNWTLFLDIKIVFQTLLKALKGDENAY